MSRSPKTKAAPATVAETLTVRSFTVPVAPFIPSSAAAAEAADQPTPTAPPQVPETTDAATVLAATEMASVDPKPELRGAEGYGVKVVGPAAGRWRIGRKFGPEAVVIPAPELTEAQMEALFDDPSLICSAVQLEVDL